MEKINKQFGICLLKCGRMFLLLSGFEMRLGISQVKFCCLENLLPGYIQLVFIYIRFERQGPSGPFGQILPQEKENIIYFYCKRRNKIYLYSIVQEETTVIVFSVLLVESAYWVPLAILL